MKKKPTKKREEDAMKYEDKNRGKLRKEEKMMDKKMPKKKMGY